MLDRPAVDTLTALSQTIPPLLVHYWNLANPLNILSLYWWTINQCKFVHPFLKSKKYLLFQNSFCDFPNESSQLETLLSTADELQSVRQRLSAEMADHSSLIRSLIVRAEDSRLMMDTWVELWTEAHLKWRHTNLAIILYPTSCHVLQKAHPLFAWRHSWMAPCDRTLLTVLVQI